MARGIVRMRKSVHIDERVFVYHTIFEQHCKSDPSMNRTLKLGYVKLESLVIANQYVAVN